MAILNSEDGKRPHSTVPSPLFDPLTLRDVTFKNRIFISPMCQYSSVDGMPTDWHLVHLGSRAVGGAACVVQEATAISSEGRISPGDAGIWSEEHVEAYSRITAFLKENGTIPAIQLAHAGRKASTSRPWEGDASLTPEQGGWWPISGPSAIAFDDQSPEPHALSTAEITVMIEQFADAARRSFEAGFEVLEIHAAHGYLLHSFLSPLSNQRTDQYGGSLENRMRFLLEVTQAVSDSWPNHLPVLVRISATDWMEEQAPESWTVDDSVELAKRLKALGVDLIDVSSGGLVPGAKIKTGPGYQVPFSAKIRAEADIATGAVGQITEPAQAERIIPDGQADVILIARESLRDPYWPLHAAHALGVDLPWPVQYERAKPRAKQLQPTTAR